VFTSINTKTKQLENEIRDALASTARIGGF